MKRQTLAKISLVLAITLTAACSDKTNAPTAKFEVAAVGLSAGALSDAGDYAIVGSLYHGVSLWRLADQERVYQWRHQADDETTLIAADFSPDGRYALTADTHSLVLWEVASGQAMRFWAAPSEILSVALATDGRTALLGLTDHKAVLFDVQRGGVLHTFQHSNRVRSVALSDDQRIAITGSEDYSAVAWDVSTGKALARIAHEDDVQLVALASDGSLALSVSKYDKAVVWHTATGKILGEVPLAAEHLRRGLRFTTARFSKDKRWLLTGRPDERVTLWRLPPSAVHDTSVSGDALYAAGVWRVPKRNAWKPTGAAILDVAFVSDWEFKVIASNGFAFTLTAPQATGAINSTAPVAVPK